MFRSLWIGRLWLAAGKQETPSWFVDTKRVPSSGPCIAIGIGRYAFGAAWLKPT